jgi:Uma2 family endonuclease
MRAVAVWSTTALHRTKQRRKVQCPQFRSRAKREQISGSDKVELGNIYWLLRSFVEAHPIGTAFFAPVDVVLSNFDVVVPDLFYMSHERAAQALTHANVRGTPELVIEVASPGTGKRDETIKLRLYERTGVLEYWIVDPRCDVIRVYRRAEDAFGPALQLSLEAGDVLTTSLLPGLELPLKAVFKDHQAIT